MHKDDVQHLADLARIAITDKEAEAFTQEIDAVLAYVSSVEDIAAAADLTKTVGPRHNVFRADEVTNAADTYTETLLAEAPKRHGRFLEVKKILNQE